MGLDPAGVECLGRLVDAWDSGSEQLVVRRLDLQRVLTALEVVGRWRSREVPRLALSDEEYERLVRRRLEAAYGLARGVTPLGLDQAGLELAGSAVPWLERVSPLVAARRLAAALSMPIGALLTDDVPAPRESDSAGGSQPAARAGV